MTVDEPEALATEPVESGVPPEEVTTPGEEMADAGEKEKKGKKGKKGKGIGKKKGKKGKKKKPKVSKAEKEQMKLEKAIKDYMSDEENFKSFVARMDRWRAKHCQEMITQCEQFDLDGSGTLDYDSFKLVMLDMDIPCNFLEIEIFSRLIDLGSDPESDMPSGYIEYSELTEPLIHHRAIPDNIPVLTGYTKPDSVKRSPKFIYAGYLRLRVLLHTFKEIETYPGHVTLDVKDDISISTLAALVQKRAMLQGVSHVSIHRWDSADHSEVLKSSSALDGTLSLEQAGYTGSEQDYEPNEYTLIYDFKHRDYKTSILDPFILHSR